MINDCINGDDETNCFHVSKGCARMFRCSSGQCVHLKHVCDGYFHCMDHSDETYCLDECNFVILCNDSNCVLQLVKDDLIPDCRDNSDEPMYELLLNRRIDKTYRCPEIGMIPCEMGHNRCFSLTLLCLLEFNIHNHLTPCRNGAHLKHCKHFPCTGSFKCPKSYYVPMRYICNNIIDCPNGEDESGCPSSKIQCPGLLRCKEGGCVHPLKICDGVVNCPQGEDEMCIIKCPPGCICKGLALFCYSVFQIDMLLTRPLHLYLKPEKQFPMLEFSSVEILADLVVLDMRNNFLSKIPKQVSTLSELKYLDISHNLIAHIPAESFIALRSCQTLVMKGNLISSISDYGFQGLHSLPHLNLEDQSLSEIGDFGFSGLQRLKCLDVRNNELQTLKSEWFIPLKELVHLYLNDNGFLIIDPLLFNLIPNIEMLHTSQSALCCLSTRELLCQVDAIETTPNCDRPITSKSLLVLTFVLIAGIIMGNILVIYVRLISKIKNVNSLTIVSLAVADTLQGVCVSVVITTHLLYQEAYGMMKWVWRNSFLCSAVGFLQPLSSCISVSSAIMIALDRYKVVVNPFSVVTESRGIKLRLCVTVLSWLVFSFISYLPLSPLIETSYILPSDICFIHISDNIGSIPNILYIYVYALYVVFIPFSYCIATAHLH